MSCYHYSLLLGNYASKFRKVFGVEQFDTHFKTSAEFTTALEGKQLLLQHFDTTRSTGKESVLEIKTETQTEEEGEGVGEFVNNHVLCTSYVGGKAMR